MSTSNRPEAAARPSSDRSQTFLDWLQINSRWLVIGGAAVVVGALGFWFYSQLRLNRETSANRLLVNAQQSLKAQNAALAQTDLQRILGSYSNTVAGVEAAMLMATIQYDQGKYQEGINVLQKALEKSPAAEADVAIHSLIGDGYAQLKKLPEAAQAYMRAADAAHPKAEKLERAHQLAKAARTFAAAGKSDDAKRVWTQLAEGDVEAMAAEARVRLAELNARVATK